MRAIAFYKHGPPEVLREIERDDPKLDTGYAIIRISKTSLNRLDILTRYGYDGIKTEMPHIPGSDISGTIEAIDEKSGSDLSEGDRVISHPLISCGVCDICKSGNEILCRDWHVTGRETDGSYAELAKVRIESLIRQPAGISVEEAACLPLSLSTAWRAVKSLSGTNKGDSIAITGASGNVGIFSTLISKALGMNVIAFSRDKRRETELKRIGADLVINSNSNSDDIIKEIMDYTNGSGVGAVIDCLGSTIDTSVQIVKNGGVIVSYGALLGHNAQINIRRVYLKSVKLIGTHISSKKEFCDAIDFISENGIKPVIGKVVPIKDASYANQLLENYDIFGKIVLDVNFR